MNAHEKPDLADARWLVKWFRQSGKAVFKKREAHRAGQQRFETVEDLERALDLLEKRGYIRELPSPKKTTGRPPSPKYAVNPAVFEKPIVENPMTISTEAEPEPFDSNSVNSVTDFLGPDVEFDEGGILL